MKLYYYYDQEADIFYFSHGRPSAKAASEESSEDVILRRDPATGKVVGFTVLNVSRRSQEVDASVGVELPIDISLAARV